MAPQPTVSFLNGATLDSFIGTQVTTTLRFDNTASGTDVGYAPFINIILPTNGADGAGAGSSPVNDGVTFVSAKYLGADVDATLIEFPASGVVSHPFAKLPSGAPMTVTGTPGQTLLVLNLPFGSFTSTQTPTDIELKLNISNLADLNVPLNLQATGGFAFGADEFNNTATDPVIMGTPALQALNPTVATLDKIYLGPEQETATGPSYERIWQVQADFAPGQPFTNVTLTDRVPDGVVIIGTPRLHDGNGNTLPGTVTVTGPYGSQVITAVFDGTITGGAVKPTLEFNWYVTEFLSTGEPVLNPDNGSFRPLLNDAKLDASWDPIDGRDPVTITTIDPAGPEDIVTAKSIAIQKGVALVDPVTGIGSPPPDADANGVPDWQPGGTLQYTLDGQVSNYFEMQELNVYDTLGDGQTFKAGFTPTIVIMEGGVEIYRGPVLYTLGSKGADGRTPITFHVSQTMIGATLDGVLDGNGGGLGDVPHAANYNQATVLITFQSTLDREWVGPVPADANSPQDRLVDQGDPVRNSVEFGGDVFLTGEERRDDSRAGVQLPVNNVDKSIYAINGNTALGTDNFGVQPLIQAGDLVTYRLTLDIPLTSSHNVTLKDFLPLPVFRAADPDANGVANGFTYAGITNAPGVGQWSLMTTDTLHLNAPGVLIPGVSVTQDPVGNSILWNFGDITNTAYPRTTLDLLFTVRVNDAPFGDGLKLTNQVTSRETNSFNTPFEDNDIIRFVLGEPRLKITKGVVAENNSGGGVFTNATTNTSAVGPSGVTWNAPGSATAFSGTITSQGLQSRPVDANLFQADARDTVTFAVVLENLGSGPRGAFDTLIRDTIPTGFTLGAVPLNLKVVDGTGAAIAYTGAPADLFTTGIELVDPGARQGAVGAFDPTSGKNIIVITYDLRLDDNVQAMDRLVNTATTADYAAEEGGINRTATDSLPNSDTAFVEITPKIGKTVINTSNPDTFGPYICPAASSNVTATFTVDNGGATNPPTTTVTVTEMPGGHLLFTLSQAPNAGNVADIRGLFFHVNNEALLGTLSATGTNVTDFMASANNVNDLGNGANVNGLPNPDFDVGVEFGTPGIGSDDIRSTSFVLSSSAQPLTLAFVENMGFGLRLTSFGQDGGARNGSLKMAATSAPASACPPSGQVLVNGTLLPVGTSNEGQAGLVDLAIGETVTWRVTVTVPEGVSKNLTIKDVLPGGVGSSSAGPFELVSVTTATVGSNIIGSGVLAGSTGVITNSNADAWNDTVTFSFGDVTNAPDNVENAADRISFDITARVLDTPGNVRGQVETNIATISVTNTAGQVRDTSVTSSVELVEPVLSINKTVSPSTVDADDTFTYTVTLTNTNGTFRAPAYEVSIDDLLAQLPPNAVFLPGTVALVGAQPIGTSIITGNGATDSTVKVTTPRLLEGQSVTFTFQAKATAGAISGQTIPNVATATGTSMPGTPPSDRTYNVQDDALVTIASPSITKSVFATSFDDTGDARHTAGRPDVKVDEIVTYRMVVTVPEGQSINFRVIDTLADQLISGSSGLLQYIPGSAKVISAGANLFSAGGMLTPAITPTDTNGNGTTDRITYSFGNVTNTPDNVSDTKDQIVLEIQARAQNVPANQNDDDLTNSAQAVTDFSSSNTATATVDFVQPELDVQKTTSFTTGDAADIVTYRVVVQHTANSTAHAYNLALGDILPPGVTLVADSATTSVGTVTEVAGGIQLNLASYNLGSAPIVITYQVKLADNVVNNQSITNTVNLEYHTDPTPGRILTDSDDATIGVRIADTIVKDIIATSNAYTPGSTMVPGEEVTFRLTVTLGEGAQRLTVQDALPTGLEYVSSKVVSLGGITGSALAVNAAGTHNAGTNVVNFNFGDVINPGNNVQNAADQVVIEVVAKVAAGVAAGTNLTNVGTVTPFVPNNPYGVPPGTPMTPSSDNEVVNVQGLAAVGDKAFVDLNADGQQQLGEPGLAGVQVQLFNADTGALVGTQTTNSSGLYLFTNLQPGKYYEVWNLPAGYVRTDADTGADATDSDPAASGPNAGRTSDFTLLVNQTDLTRDAGYWIPVKLGDKVFEDQNGNGIQDGADTPLANVTVNLLNSSGTVIGTQQTDSNGNYLFTGLKPGTYSVEFIRPAGFVFTDRDTGLNDAIDSDANTTTGRTTAKTYISGDDDRTIDAGMYRPVTIGDTVFEDNNGNGIQDAGDTPLGGVTVRLLDGSNGVVGTLVTDSSGQYLFTGLKPGSYRVEVVKPAGYTFTAPDVGLNDAIDSDTHVTTGQTPLKTYTSGADDRTVDSGLFKPVKLGDYAWIDRDGDGVQDSGEAPLPGVQVQLINTATNTVIATATTDATGKYEFIVPPGTYREVWTPPAGYVPTIIGQGTAATDSNVNPATGQTGPIVLVSGQDDMTWDGGFYIPVRIGDRVFEDQNGNGIQDAEDTNLANVRVDLLDGSGNIVATQFTDVNGNYLFTGLRPQDYAVKFTAPAGFNITDRDVGLNDAIDSDPNPLTGVTVTKTYFSGDVDLTIDAGMWRPVTIGDRTWVDINRDGLQQTLEPGLGGITVRLIDDRTGLVVGTQTTTPNGDYLFTGYKPSEYHVEFTTPTGYVVTTPLVGGNRAIDSNPDAAGVAPQIRLLSGQEDRTIDAGYQGTGKVSGNVFLQLPPGICGYKLPDAVFAGITVQLITTTGLIAGTAITGNDGTYQFNNVAPGSYVARFTAPDGTMFSLDKQAGTQGARDSDVNTNGVTDAFTVINGAHVTQINAGLAYKNVGLTGLPGDVLANPGSYNFDFAGAFKIGLNGSYNMMGNGGAAYFIGGTGDNNLQSNGSQGGILVGGHGSNIFEGSSGRDIIIGGCGPNNMQGLGNNGQGLGAASGCWNYDLLVGGPQGDIITGNHGRSIMLGGRGNDAIDGFGMIVGGPNNGTISFNAGQFSNFSVGDHIKIGSGQTTVHYQVGDGVQWIENFNPGRGDTIEVWGYGAPTAVGTVNGMGVLYFGPNAAIVFNGWQPQNGPLTGINYHAGQAQMAGAFGRFDALPPVVLYNGLDSFYGTQGDDIAIGSNFPTTFRANGGDDLLIGGNGNNLFIGGAGNDHMIGGQGNDIFRIGQGSDVVVGCGGNNVVQLDYTAAQVTVVNKGGGHYVLMTPAGEQHLSGVQWVSFTDQNLRLTDVAAAPGAVLFGTNSHDGFQINDARDMIVERPDSGNDAAWVAADGWIMSPEVETARLIGNAANIKGNALDNIIVANAGRTSYIDAEGGNDEIWGSDNNGEILNGGAGDDIIRSGTGTTTMIGGAGNDQFVVNNSGDVIVETAGEGVDTAWVTVNGWTVANNVEIVRLVCSATSVNIGTSGAQVVANTSGSMITAQLGDNVFWGQGGNDTFVGGAGNDIFYAGGGATTMYGGAGTDHFIIKNLGDRAFENANEGHDTAWIAVNNWTVGDNIEVAYLCDHATMLTGNATGGHLVANSTAGSTLIAGGGYTTFWGSNFDDVFKVGPEGGVMYGYAGADDFWFGRSSWGTVEISDFSRAEGDKIQFTGSGINTMGQLNIITYSDKTLIQHGANQIILYGVSTPMLASDFVF